MLPHQPPGVRPLIGPHHADLGPTPHRARLHSPACWAKVIVVVMPSANSLNATAPVRAPNMRASRTRAATALASPPAGCRWWVRWAPWLTLLVLLTSGPAAPSGADLVMELAGVTCVCGGHGGCADCGGASDDCCPEGACSGGGCACHSHQAPSCVWCPTSSDLFVEVGGPTFAWVGRVTVGAHPPEGTLRPGFLQPLFRPPITRAATV